MEIAQYIIQEARQLLSCVDGVSLPQQIPSAPEFFVAVAEDLTIQAFDSIEHEGKQYKVGTRK